MAMDTARRDFLTRLFTGVVVAGTSGKVLGQVVPRILDTDTPDTIQAEYEIDLSLSKYANLLKDFSSVSITGTGITSSPVIVMRTGVDTYVALENRCTHESGRLGAYSTSSNTFTCGLHGAQFDQSGTCKKGPNGGPASLGSLTSYPVTFDKAANKLILNRLTDVSDLTPDAYTVRCYPNPASTDTTFEFGIEASGIATLDLFDVRGAKIATVVSGFFNEGMHRVPFDVNHLASGTYSYRLTTHQGFVTVRQLNVAR